MGRKNLVDTVKNGASSAHGAAQTSKPSGLNPNASKFTSTSSVSVSKAAAQPSRLSTAVQGRRASRRGYGNGTHFGGTQLGTIDEVEQLTTNFGAVTLTNNATMNPSEAPSRSTFGADWRSPSHLTTQMSSQTQTQWIRTQTCVRSPYNRRKYKRGHIISLPFHQPNLAEDVQQSDPLLTITKHGPVYTKRRMAVVLWRYKNEMTCLPIYSWHGRGILSKPEYLWDQYMELINAGPEASRYEVKGVYDALRARMNRPLGLDGCVCLSAGFRVDYHEDIVIVGQLESESIKKMMVAWNNLKNESEKEQC